MIDGRPSRILECFASPRDFSRLSYPILSKIGYEIVSCEERQPDQTPALRLVDERRLSEVPDDPPDALVPMILLAGWQGFDTEDRRVIGAVRRPAGLHELFRLLQLALEDHPRAVPRAATRIPACLRRDGLEWEATMLSLSENGCLLRTAVSLPLSATLECRFEVPGFGEVETQATAGYQMRPNLGLVFHATRPRYRRAIGDYVTETLAR